MTCSRILFDKNDDVFLTGLKSHHKNVASIGRPKVRSWVIPIGVQAACELRNPSISFLVTFLKSRPTISILVAPLLLLPSCSRSRRAGSLWPAPLTARMIEFRWGWLSQLLSNWICNSWTSIHLWGSRWSAIEWVPTGELIDASHLVEQAKMTMMTMETIMTMMVIMTIMTGKGAGWWQSPGETSQWAAADCQHWIRRIGDFFRHAPEFAPASGLGSQPQLPAMSKSSSVYEQKTQPGEDIGLRRMWSNSNYLTQFPLSSPLGPESVVDEGVLHQCREDKPNADALKSQLFLYHAILNRIQVEKAILKKKSKKHCDFFQVFHLMHGTHSVECLVWLWNPCCMHLMEIYLI